MIDISGLSKTDVLMALYNAATPRGAGFLQYDPAPLTKDEAESLMDRPYFDYVKGRVLKVDLDRDSFDPRLYNRDNGDGTAERAIAVLRETGAVQSEELQTLQHNLTLDAAAQARVDMKQGIEITDKGGYSIVTLGLANIAPELDPKLKQVEESER
jgi:hypothetical protein